MNPSLLSTIKGTLCLLLFALVFSGHSQKINFESSKLKNLSVHTPTSLQFGPDGRLYLTQQDGIIKVLTIERNGPENYTVIQTETISSVKQIPNHNDDGTPHDGVKRQLTGIEVAGTPSNPIIYVASSDYRIGAGSSGDKGFCTNSGIISRLTWTGSEWDKVDIVRGLPRSEENHAPNGLVYDKLNNRLYVTVGGLTNSGGPSKAFTYSSEYALSAAVLSVDLTAIEGMPLKPNGAHPYIYDLPTLDDPDRPNNPDGSDQGDPFGGNDGLNQAKIVQGGPVQIFAPGFRNAYDVIITETPGRENRVYVSDNGANPGWGGHPKNEGGGNVVNDYPEGEPGSTSDGINDGMVNNHDGLHYIGDNTNYQLGSYYGGHPCPIRANPAGAGWFTHSGDINGGTKVWRTSKTNTSYPLPSDWPPVPVSMADPVQGDFQNPGVKNDAIITFTQSVNGICEYPASAFNGAMQGDILAAGFEGGIFRIKLNSSGDQTLNEIGDSRKNLDQPFASGFGTKPLDIIAQRDDEVFPGTIWVALYSGSEIMVFEPKDNGTCTEAYSTSLDEDGDGYSNADEIDSNTNPCSAASKPEDFDEDLISDRNDTDDDNDGIADLEDPFARDDQNGLATSIPLEWTLFNNDPGTGMFGLGFTGLMTNGVTDYLNQYDISTLIAGGAAGAFTIDAVPEGKADGSSNDQLNGFQFGVNVNSATKPFTIDIELSAPFFNNQPLENNQNQGVYIGTGDQDNYLKLALNANNGLGELVVLHENDGLADIESFEISDVPSSSLNLIFNINPETGIVLPGFKIDGSSEVSLGDPVVLSGKIKDVLQSSSKALAIGFISTSDGPATEFNATWDHVLIKYQDETETPTGEWELLTSSDGSEPLDLHEHAFVEVNGKFYGIGGRGGKKVQIFDPVNKVWTTGAAPPIELNHFQGISYQGKIWALGAFTGGYPTETPVPNIYIYDPAADSWTVGPEIPEGRRRGSGGALVYNDKFYLISGITNGHTSGHVNWVDEFDPATGEWQQLPDIPHARDHFHAVAIQNKIYVAAGRKSSYPNTFGITVPEVDVYNFTTGSWETLSEPIPTERAGVTAVSMGDELVVLGGESLQQMDAYDVAEALNSKTQTWKELPPMLTGRQGFQGVAYNGSIYVFGGNATRGGSSNLNTLEKYNFVIEEDTSSEEPDNPGDTAVIAGGLFFINSGGEEISTGNWEVDTEAEPTEYSNAADNYNKVKTETFSGNNFTSAPDNIFSTYRWDAGVEGDDLNKELSYNFPVENGSYQVKLYFAETYYKATEPGFRVFDIRVEGETLLEDFDITAEFGFNTAGEKVLSTEVTDGELNIYFIHKTENPKINGIAIYKEGAGEEPPAEEQKGLLAATPSVISFGQVSTGSSLEKELYLKNSGDATLSISSQSITGNSAFASGLQTPQSVSAGDSVKVLITFNPESEGAAEASWSIVHNGSNSPISVALSGTGQTETTNPYVTITEPENGAEYTSPASINVFAEATSKTGNSDNAQSFSYFEISSPDGGWRKLKLGYNSNSIYSGAQDLVASGNSKLEIVMKDISGNSDWSKLEIRPQGYTESKLVLAPYWNNAIEEGNGWKRMTIPFSDFLGSEILENISMFELPYSPGAGSFTVGLKEVKATGGSEPFIWFGGTKTDNVHDGFGGGGQLLASLAEESGQASEEVLITKVSFYSNSSLAGADSTPPYTLTLYDQPEGSYSLTATAEYSDGSSETSSPVTVFVKQEDQTEDPAPTEEGVVVLRVNAGDYEQDATDTSGVTWQEDTYNEPSSFVNANETGNKTYKTSNTISLNSSIPEGVPSSIFQSERSVGNWTVDTLSWDFNIDKGGEVEVRLFFAEIFFTQPGQRVFDVQIEDSVKLKDYDIVQDVGSDTGVVKTFRATSDGQLDVNFIRIKQHPKINGIEIVCLNDICSRSNLRFGGGYSQRVAEKSEPVSVYPNPAKENVNITVNLEEEVLELFLFDSKGNLLKQSEIGRVNGITDLALDLSEVDSGIYLLKLSSKSGFSQTVKVIKE